MYERLTDRARKVFQLANQEAQRFNHEYVATEHVLLGLLKEGSGVAANVLKNLDVSLGRIREEIEKLVTSGPEATTLGKLPMTPRAKKVVDYAMEESRSLNHNYVGTEHLLIGLLREQEGVASQVLQNLGMTLDATRESVLKLLGAGLDVRGGNPAQSDKPSDPMPLALSVWMTTLTDRQARRDLAERLESAERQLGEACVNGDLNAKYRKEISRTMELQASQITDLTNERTNLKAQLAAAQDEIDRLSTLIVDQK